MPLCQCIFTWLKWSVPSSVFKIWAESQCFPGKSRGAIGIGARHFPAPIPGTFSIDHQHWALSCSFFHASSSHASAVSDFTRHQFSCHGCRWERGMDWETGSNAIYQRMEWFLAKLMELTHSEQQKKHWTAHSAFACTQSETLKHH